MAPGATNPKFPTPNCGKNLWIRDEDRVVRPRAVQRIVKPLLRQGVGF